MKNRESGWATLKRKKSSKNLGTESLRDFIRRALVAQIY